MHSKQILDKDREAGKLCKVNPMYRSYSDLVIKFNDKFTGRATFSGVDLGYIQKDAKGNIPFVISNDKNKKDLEDVMKKYNKFTLHISCRRLIEEEWKGDVYITIKTLNRENKPIIDSRIYGCSTGKQYECYL